MVTTRKPRLVSPEYKRLPTKSQGKLLKYKHAPITISTNDPPGIYSLKERFGGEIPKIDLYQVDLTERSSIDKIFEAYESKGKIWGVIHLAVSIRSSGLRSMLRRD